MAVKASGRFVPPSAFAAGTGKAFTGAYAWNAPREAVGRERPLISISLMLTERTLVSEVDGALHVKNIPEPLPPEPVTRPVELYINGELVSKWDE